MKKIASIMLFIVMTNCSKTITNNDLLNINGYWRIHKVSIENETVELPLSIHMDYFFVNDSLKGFRKKLTANMVGKFEQNNHDEKIEIQNSEAGTYIFYKTAYDTWKEEIVSISDKELVVLNKEGKTYHYNRFSESE